MSALTRIAECADAPRFRPAQEALARRRAIDDQELTALMRAAQRGDRSAYASLLREVMSLLQRLFRHRLRYLQPADREDVMQEVLLSLHRAKSTYDPAKAFVPWLMAIIRNRVVDRARRCARLSANEVLVGEFDAIGPVAGFAQRDGEYRRSRSASARDKRPSGRSAQGDRVVEIAGTAREGRGKRDGHERWRAQGVGPSGYQQSARRLVRRCGGRDGDAGRGGYECGAMTPEAPPPRQFRRMRETGAPPLRGMRRPRSIADDRGHSATL